MNELKLAADKNYTICYTSDIDLSFVYHQYKKQTIIMYDGMPAIMGGHKPNGLWYAFGDGWIRYKYPNKKPIELSPIFEISIDKSNFIRLSSLHDILLFNDTYKVGEDGHTINWLEVANKYDGIEIQPFDSSLCNLYWYRTFDLDSGCIWNLSKVKKLTLLNSSINNEKTNQHTINNYSDINWVP